MKTVKISIMRQLEEISNSISWAWCNNKITDPISLGHLREAKHQVEELIKFINLEDENNKT